MESIINNSKQKSAFWGVIHYMLFSAQGRINRMQHFLGLLALSGFLIASMLVLYPLFVWISHGDPGVMAAGLILISIAFFAFAYYCGIMMAIKRAHDLDLSGHICWLFLVPVINFGLNIYLLFGPGMPVQNRFGLPPSNINAQAGV
jgi:uncharacterized membrane protein YhaH (DUF805 family)